MKYLVKSILIWILCSFAVSATAVGGHDVGSGGDRDEILLRSILMELSGYLESPQNRSRFPQIDRGILKSLIVETKIQLTEVELRDPEGRIRTAINQAEMGRILVNRELFTPIREDAKLVVPLIFHEVLGLMKLEGSGEYAMSSEILGDATRIYEAATANMSAIYFLTGDALVTPIPLWKASVVIAHRGTFESGVVARPFVLITDRIKVVIDQGQTIKWERRKFKNKDRANETWVEGLFIQDNNHPDLSYFRPNASEPWQQVSLGTFALIPPKMATGLIEEKDIYYGRIYSKGGFDLSTNVISGKFERLAFNENGDIEAAWCLTDCTYLFGKQWMKVEQVVKEKDRYKVYFSERQILSVAGRRTPLSFPAGPLIVMNSNFEVTWGAVKAFVVLNGTRYDIGHIEVDSKGQVEVYQNKLFERPNYAGTPLLATESAALAYCSAIGISMDRPSFESETIYFTGERTFYDFEKSDFVTLKSNPVKVFKEIRCGATVKVDVNDLQQEVPVSENNPSTAGSCESSVTR
jgi:hypothetical protein